MTRPSRYSWKRFAKYPLPLRPVFMAGSAALDGLNWLFTTPPAVALQRKASDADSATWRWETEPLADCRKLCVFVTYSPDGQIPERAVTHARIWRDAGYEVLFVIALDDMEVHPRIPFGHAIARENRGHDFAAWSRAISEIELGGLTHLATVNDSVYTSEKLADAIARAEDSEAEMVGFTESRECRWHIQSYAVLFKAPLIQSRAFTEFWTPRECSRRRVIWTYETQMAQTMRDAGFRVEALFPLDRYMNPTHFYWPQLAARGFPYVKRSSLPQKYDEWEPALAAHGFDAELIARDRPKVGSRSVWRKLVDAISVEELEHPV